MRTSDIKKIESDLRQKNEKLKLLYGLTSRGIGGNTLNDIANITIDSVKTAYSPDLILFYLKNNGYLEIKGFFPPDEKHINERKKVGACLCGLAAKKGKAVFSSDINNDDRCTLNECKDAGMKSFAALPLTNEKKIIGVLGIASKEARDFSAEKEFLETLSGAAALLTSNILLIERIRQHSHDLEKKVLERTAELEEKNRELKRLNKLFVGRELRMAELKKRIKELEVE